MKHNSRAVYQRYMGWYDGNPSTSTQLPPEEAAKKYVEYMGGADAVLEKAQADFDKGEYRWVAEALKHVVFADPTTQDGKELLADTYEQMGYQAESRTVALGLPAGRLRAAQRRAARPAASTRRARTPSRAMPPEMLFDFLGVRLNGPKAAGKKITLDFDFTDLKKQYALTVENGVLNHARTRAANADATLTLTKRRSTRFSSAKSRPSRPSSIRQDEDRRASPKRSREFIALARHVPVLVQHRDAQRRRAPHLARAAVARDAAGTCCAVFDLSVVYGKCTLYAKVERSPTFPQGDD